MTQCKCGFSEGDRVITISWDGHSDDGCWVSSMRELVGQEGVITRISHDDYNNRCVAEAVLSLFLFAPPGYRPSGTHIVGPAPQAPLKL